MKTIQQGLELLIKGGLSYRAVEKACKLFNQSEAEENPSYTCIRKWLGRIGIYELKREKEYRDDWIFIVDLTVELGQQKALVVLGITQEKLSENVRQKKRGLSHQDVEVLGLEILTSTKGEIIEYQLDKISSLVGVPVQIVADNGSDLARGIKLYQEKHPELIYTHDVTHAMALLLKNQLDLEQRYESFIHKSNICRQKLQQTELSFLSPPSQRSQCRYFNVERLTNWGIKLLNAPGETLSKLMPNVAPEVIAQRIREKLGWLADYELDLRKWHQMVSLTRSAETWLKVSGISSQSGEHFAQNQSRFSDKSLLDLQDNILDYLAVQCDKIKQEGIFLATSDVIESIFGKYKHFSTRCPLKQMGQMVLTICLFTMKLTNTVVKNALSQISFTDVEAWLAEVFGQSIFSKRKTLFSANYSDTETV